MEQTLLESVRSRLGAKKVPIAKVAEVSGVSERSLYHLLSGEHSPRWSTIEAVLVALKQLRL